MVGKVLQSFEGKMSCPKVARENGKVENGTPKFWTEKDSCIKVGQESGRVTNGTPKFWREMSCLKVGRESGRVVNGTPNFWRENVVSQNWAGNWLGWERYANVLAEKRRVSKLGGKVAWLGMVRQCFGVKTSCLKVGRESSRVGNGTPKFWQENITSQSWAGK
jgi:hypothetical protein